MDTARTRIALVFITAAMLMSIVTFFYWDFVRDTIVVPIYFLLWLSDLVIKSVPQAVYLAFLILVCIGIALNAVLGAPLKQNDRRQARNLPTDSTRYTHWKRLHRSLYGNPFFRNQFAIETRKLLLTMLAYQEGLDSAQVEAQILDGRLSVPPAVHYLIEHKAFAILPYETTVVANTWTRLRQRLFRTEAVQPLPENDQVNEVVAFIEHRMEISHAGNQRPL